MAIVRRTQGEQNVIREAFVLQAAPAGGLAMFTVLRTWAVVFLV